MGKREELAAQLEKLQAELDEVDQNDYECVVEVDGKATRVTGSVAKKWLQKIGLADADPAPADPADPAASPADPPPAKSGSKFFD